MNPDCPPLHPSRCHGGLGGCKDGTCHHSGAAPPDFNDLGFILPFFLPFFLADTSSEPSLGWVIIACAAASPGTCVCRCHVLYLLMGSSQGMAMPWGVPHETPSSAQPPPAPQSYIAPEDFSLGNSLKKINRWTKKKPTTRKEKNHKQPPGKFSGVSLKKTRERGKKKEAVFFPGPNAADLLAREMHSW